MHDPEAPFVDATPLLRDPQRTGIDPLAATTRQQHPWDEIYRV
jgi:hypothetical protein